MVSLPMPKPSYQVEKHSKFLAYVLGRKPDEFGLVPDSDGWVTVKELLQALHEEPGWRHIRMAHINEVLICLPYPSVQIEENRIRATDQSRLPVPGPPDELPKLLYLAIRSRAYPAALDKGLVPTPQRPYLVLAGDEAMAKRMGRRHDNHPTLLTVQVAEAISRGTTFNQYGLLFLANMIDSGAFTGPPLRKEKPGGPATADTAATSRSQTPGSYFPSFDMPDAAKSGPVSGKRRKEPQWQKSRRQARRHKAKLQK